MIDILHWLSSFIVLSVALAHLEAIKITATGPMRVLVRALGWGLVGMDAFASILHPLFPYFNLGCKLGEIGLAVLAVSYGWQGATKHVRLRP